MLDIENRAWVVTPQKAYAETTLYELVVSTTSSLYKVAVDIIDYNPLTDIEQVSKPLPRINPRRELFYLYVTLWSIIFTA